ncbi:MAG TPA: AmmeMemoRadiSam system radical SAM enzyme [Nitrospirae bacterium]|nr:pyruvate formate lyase-activating enzyme 1 [bacterium BMS3Abin09]GBE40430.1 pyruvate formate lyase-activating enzyme 1 [bacterium BMS3Bbin09]HDH34507.1 AmmeMemoRadiSam system radical SAM enzyme [Nitrospirota bacterium]HDO67036.1 AmmeMemoRadiSam system radical SAM enzyme [Nitrospirota bacterium]HDZ84232.1 AmmeMemoRadiSam system radical SAM enzyme [Nitrospirota bacterium]
MKEAMFYEKLDESKVRCFLCAHQCTVSDRKRGLCGVRENIGGIFYSLVYGKLISMNIDPIEKKPLFHFSPASHSMSIATAGCNFRCMHCQNYDISQYLKEHIDIPGQDVTPEQVVNAAEEAGCKSISYTYTEPTVYFEFACDCARLARDRGIKNVFVSNGYTGPEAVKAIAPFLDGNNIDLKGDDEFYKKVCGAKLQPVLNTIKLMHELGVWVEITTLIIPGYNDSEESLERIIAFIKSVDTSIPWHITQFSPTYKLMDRPRTPLATLRMAREMGIASGLKYIYEGNVPGEGRENTYCPNCGELLVERSGYMISHNKIRDDKCFSCSTKIEGVWT